MVIRRRLLVALGAGLLLQVKRKGGSMEKKEIIGLLEKEIKWCLKNPLKHIADDYQNGFVKGLKQAIFIIKRVGKK